MFFKSHQKEIQSQIAEYCQHVRTAMDRFVSAIDRYGQSADRSRLEEDLRDVHEAEHLADNIRESVEVRMHSKAVFPESRGDILELLEQMDKVPNATESSLRMILEQHICLPREYHPKLMELVDVCRQAAEIMIEAVDRLFGNYTEAATSAGRIDQMESQGDALEGELIEEIFSGDRDGFEKLLLRDLVKHIARISDRAEDVGRHIEVMVAKRSI